MILRLDSHTRVGPASTGSGFYPDATFFLNNCRNKIYVRQSDNMI
jgi:hypothetical protein